MLFMYLVSNQFTNNMRRFFNLGIAFYILTSGLIILSNELYAQVPPEIQNPEIYGINKLPPRTSAWPSPSVESAKTSTYETTNWVKSLNGSWDFHWSSDPQSRPVDFYKPGFDRTDWDQIPVPSTIERQGYGVPLYVNIKYPFKTNPPMVMDEPDSSFTTYNQRNPVGSYIRHFTVPSSWLDKEIIIHFAGISSAAFVWVNGEQVGYSQGSRLPAEFDITKYVNEIRCTEQSPRVQLHLPGVVVRMGVQIEPDPLTSPLSTQHHLYDPANMFPHQKR